MIIDGQAIAATLNARLKRRIDALVARPKLTVVLVGENPASKVYVTMKTIRCKEVGIESEKIKLPATTTQAELLETVNRLNTDASVHGILVQMPLPEQIDERAIIEAISPAKDVDCFHPVNVGRMQLGTGRLSPCTPKGVIRLLEESGIPIAGKHAVVVGRSDIVGKPLAQLLIEKNATVTICHSRTQDLAAHTRQADILIAAVGRPGLITADMVKQGATVIDVGVNRIDDPAAEKGYRLVGDVVFDAVKEKAGAITPVPGGVGPMTIAMLLENTLIALEDQR